MGPKSISRRPDAQTSQAVADLGQNKAEAGPSRFPSIPSQKPRFGVNQAYDDFSRGQSSAENLSIFPNEQPQRGGTGLIDLSYSSDPEVLKAELKALDKPTLDALTEAFARHSQAANSTSSAVKPSGLAGSSIPSDGSSKLSSAALEKLWTTVVQAVQATEYNTVPRPSIRIEPTLGNLVEFRRDTPRRFAEGEVLVSQAFVTHVDSLAQEAILTAMADHFRNAFFEANGGAYFEFHGYKKVMTPFEDDCMPDPQKKRASSEKNSSDVMNRHFWYITREILGDDAVEAGRKAWQRFSYNNRTHL